MVVEDPMGNVRKVLSKIIKIVPSFIDAITNFVKNTSSMKPVDGNSSIVDVDSMIEMLESYKEEVRGIASDIEKSVYEEVTYYTEELGRIFEDSSSVLKKYGISKKRIKKQITKLSLSMKGFIDNEVSKDVSLGNPELRNIIKMIPGIQKEEALKEFADGIIKEALDKYCKNVRETLSDIFDEVEEEVLDVIEKAGNDANRHCVQLESIDAENYSEKSEKLILDADCIIAGCNILEEGLKGE